MITWQSGHGPEDFQKYLRECIAVTSRTLPELLNTKAYLIVKSAQDKTKRAVRSEIEKLGLRTVSKKDYVTSKGKKRTRRKFEFNAAEASEAYRRAFLHKAGGRAFRFVSRNTGLTTAQLARKWIAKKLRSIGFLASTWRPILRKLDRYAKEKGKTSELEIYSRKGVNVKSYAVPAVDGINPAVEIGNVIGENVRGDSLRAYAQDLLQSAFTQAMTEETASMKEHLEKNLAKRLDGVR